MIELRCMGPVSVTIDGAEPPAPLLWKKHLALLVYLARSPRGRTRDHLIGLLCPDKDELRAKHSLNEALRVLRRCSGDGLRTSGDLIALDPGIVTTDLDRLSPEAVIGEFLEGFAVPGSPEFERWLGAERERVRCEALDVLLGAGDAALAHGQSGRAARLALAGLALDDCSEPAVRLAVRALALEGKRGEALTLFERYAAALRQRIGVEPDFETARLVSRVRTLRVIAKHRAGRVVEAAPGEVVPVVGPGAAVLARLTALWSNVRDGGVGRTILIKGDAGTGKTRISDELASRARLDGAVVAAARALPGDTVEELWGALLRGGLLVPELGSAPAEALAGLLVAYPDLGGHYPAARDATPLPFRAAATTVVDAIAEDRDVMLLLDDAHLAPHPAVDLLKAVAQRCQARPLCLVLTVRISAEGSSVEALEARIGREVPGEVLSTLDLSQGDIEDLIRWALPQYDESARARLVRRAIADTGGNPFLAVELLLAVRGGLELPAESTDPAADRTLDQTLPTDLPAAVSAGLRLRYRMLSDGAQQALVAAAVLGAPASAETVALASGLGRKEVETALDELEWERWLVGDTRGY